MLGTLDFRTGKESECQAELPYFTNLTKLRMTLVEEDDEDSIYEFRGVTEGIRAGQ